jgi:ABC-2 type transport system permease protein
VLLVQRCFWVSTTSNPELTLATNFPDDLFVRGLVILGICVVFLGIAQLVFTKLEGKFAERL